MKPFGIGFKWFRPNTFHCRVRFCKFCDKNLFNFYIKFPYFTFYILGPIIQHKALEIAADMGRSPDEFGASNGWYEKWCKFYNVSMHKTCGEALDVDVNVVEAWRQKLPHIIDDYTAEEIWNLDETGLFYRALPDRTLALKGADCRGGKLAKERITVLLACSSTGEKYKLLIIGKAANPRCFKGVNKEKLLAYYSSNRKSWMTGQIL